MELPRYQQLGLWLIFAALGLGLIAFATFLIWSVVATVARSARRSRRGPEVVRALPLSAITPTTIRGTTPVAGLVWTSVLMLMPLLALAIWQLVVELRDGRIGIALVAAIVHVGLLWKLLSIGSRVARRVDLTTDGVVVQPVLGRARHLAWSDVARVEDVRYAGPGVSGVYLFDQDDRPVVFDVWLPGWRSVALTARDRLPRVPWRIRQRLVL